MNLIRPKSGATGRLTRNINHVNNYGTLVKPRAHNFTRSIGTQHVNVERGAMKLVRPKNGAIWQNWHGILRVLTN